MYKLNLDLIFRQKIASTSIWVIMILYVGNLAEKLLYISYGKNVQIFVSAWTWILFIVARNMKIKKWFNCHEVVLFFLHKDEKFVKEKFKEKESKIKKEGWE